ncbi:MAG: beta-ketoacyl synthase N-terminal-like domain-containing protein [Clostridia bacterium]
MNRRVIITGLGFVTNEGSDSESIWDMVCRGKKNRFKSEIEDFMLPNELKDRYVGICSCARIGVKAADLAWDEALIEDSDIDRDKWGVMVGTAIGESTTLYANQCKVLVEQGTMWLLPSLAMNKSPKTTTDICSIEHKLYGGSLTFESGRIASGMAVLDAYDEITHGFLDGAVVVGTEYIDEYLISALKGVGFPGYKNVTSGACAIVLEAEGRAEGSGVKGIVASVEALASVGRPNKYNHGLYKSIRDCVEKTVISAEIGINDIDLVIYSKVNNPVADYCCEKALAKLFEFSRNQAAIISATDILGDIIGANPVMGIGLGLIFLDKQCIVSNNVSEHRLIKNVLIVEYDISGYTWAMVLKSCF